MKISNTVTTAAPFSDLETAAKDFTDTIDNTPGGSPNYHAHGSASQNSAVSATGFSGSGSVTADSYWLPYLGTENIDGNAQTGYTVDFTVPIETFFTITGELDTQSFYHLGRREMTHTSLVLTGSTTGAMYSAGGDYVAPPPPPSNTFSLDIPISYSTLLEPGQTYTLSALATADADNPQDGDNDASRLGSASFNFVATVPEPASIGVMFVAGTLLLGQRRRVRMDRPTHSPW